jgi:hypothetical protein
MIIEMPSYNRVPVQEICQPPKFKFPDLPKLFNARRRTQGLLEEVTKKANAVLFVSDGIDPEFRNNSVAIKITNNHQEQNPSSLLIQLTMHPNCTDLEVFKIGSDLKEIKCHSYTIYSGSQIITEGNNKPFFNHLGVNKLLELFNKGIDTLIKDPEFQDALQEAFDQMLAKAIYENPDFGKVEEFSSKKLKELEGYHKTQQELGEKLRIFALSFYLQNSDIFSFHKSLLTKLNLFVRTQFVELVNSIQKKYPTK